MVAIIWRRTERVIFGWSSVPYHHVRSGHARVWCTTTRDVAPACKMWAVAQLSTMQRRERVRLRGLRPPESAGWRLATHTLLQLGTLLYYCPLYYNLFILLLVTLHLLLYSTTGHFTTTFLFYYWSLYINYFILLLATLQLLLFLLSDLPFSSSLSEASTPVTITGLCSMHSGMKKR